MHQGKTYLTEGQSSNGRGDVVALSNGQDGCQQDEHGPNEVQPQTQPLVSCLQSPVCPAENMTCSRTSNALWGGRYVLCYKTAAVATFGSSVAKHT